MLLADHQPANIGISEVRNSDAKRSKHISIGDKLLPVDLARSERLPRHVEHCVAPRRQNWREPME
jgi:hypothetical protein